MKKIIKKTLALALVLAMTVSVAGCAFMKKEEPEPVVEEVVEEPTTAVVNPMWEVKPFEIEEEMGFTIEAPKFADNVRYFIYNLDDGKLLESQFRYEQKAMYFRAMKTKAETIETAEDLSGLYFTPTVDKTIKLRATDALVKGGDGMGYITWLDKGQGILYCLGMVEKFSEDFIEKVANLCYHVDGPEVKADMDILNAYKIHFREDGYLAPSEESENKDEIHCCYTGYDLVYLDPEDQEKYPELNETLTTINDRISDEYLTFISDTKESYFDDYGDSEWTPTLYENISRDVARADETAFTVVNYVDSYYGGAHGMYGVYANNIDTETGAELSLTDVVTDIDSLKPLIIEALEYKYDTDMMDDLDTALAYYFEDEQWDSLEWILGYNGVAFYFGPYIIGPYAAGDFCVEILFENVPEIFNPKYMTRPESYISPVIAGDVCDSPSPDYINLINSFGENLYYGYDSYVVHTKDKDYVLSFTNDPIGFSDLRTYSINTEAAEFLYQMNGVGVTGGDTTLFPTDPDDIRMVTRARMIMPIGLEQGFGFHDGEVLFHENNPEMSEVLTKDTLTLKKDFEIKKADISKGINKMKALDETETLKAGTKLAPVYSDGFYNMIVKTVPEEKKEDEETEETKETETEDEEVYYLIENDMFEGDDQGYDGVTFKDLFAEYGTIDEYMLKGDWRLSSLDLGDGYESAYYAGFDYDSILNVDDKSDFNFSFIDENDEGSITLKGLKAEYTTEYTGTLAGTTDYADEDEFASYIIKTQNPKVVYYAAILDSNKTMKVIRAEQGDDNKASYRYYFLTKDIYGDNYY